MKGQLAEDICPHVLSLDNWEELRRHPSRRIGRKAGSTNPGPDSLMLNKTSGRTYLFEWKWWENPEHAHLEGYDQVVSSYVSHLSPKEIGGAFVGILDWDTRSREGSLHGYRIWSRE